MKVYFKAFDKSEFNDISKLAEKVFSKLIKDENITLPKSMPLKVHFGEKGNKTFIPASSYKGIIEYLKNRNIETKYIETNVLYKGERTTKKSHVLLAKEHGLKNLEIEIADGDIGEEFDEIEISKQYFQKVRIGKAFSNYDGFVVLAHFKGHSLAGFGGAIKQLAMGFASRSGKMQQHASTSPYVKASKCVLCKKCIKTCDVNAIYMEDSAIIDSDKCIGCAGCIAVCPYGAIYNDWQGASFHEKLAEYAYGAQLGKKNIYINFMYNITDLCDCVGSELEIVAKDYGILASTDPVAIDLACLDILNKDYKDLFSSGRKVFEHAKKINFGSSKYKLIQI